MALIMVVDDEPDIRDSVKTALEMNGFEVATANNGDECLKKLSKIKPDLILMDIMMPGTPVREVVKKIKGVKIAYLSVVRTTDAEREELLRNGNVMGFIQKPFDIDALVKEVAKLAKK